MAVEVKINTQRAVGRGWGGVEGRVIYVIH
jgi:hypothetical protein